MLGRSLILVFSVLMLVAPAWGQWMFEKKPPATGSSFEVAQRVPLGIDAVIGFHLRGQLDIAGILTDLREGSATAPGQSDDLRDLDRELGQLAEEWIAMFSGRGYVAMLSPSPEEDWAEGIVLALQIERPDAFSKWLDGKLGASAKTLEIDGIAVRQSKDGTRFGVGKGWFFLTASRRSAERVAKALAGQAPNLGASPIFQSARTSLTGGGSGLFGFVDGAAVRRTAFGIAQLSPDHPSSRATAFWDYAVLSIDFRNESIDAFLSYSEASQKLMSALRQPGRVDADLIDLLPANQTFLSAADVRWLGNAVDTLGNEIPELGFLLAMAHTTLNEYGNFGEAFQGTAAFGSNMLEVLAQSLRQDIYVSRKLGKLTMCKTNLKNIGTACEMFSLENNGEYPTTLQQLAPAYLKEVPLCPTDGARPYSYKLVKQGDFEDLYLVSCTGHQHQETLPDHPRYSANDGLIEGWASQAATIDPDKPSEDASLGEPSLVVVVPVKNVAETHNLMLSAVESNRKVPYQECSDNLSDINTAAEIYATDHSNDYPESIAEMVPDYLAEIPTCPAAGKDTYSETYKVVKADDNDTEIGVSLFCQGHHHQELQADKPAYESNSGLETGPLKEVAVAKPALPGKGQSATYLVTDGPKAVLDTKDNVLRLSYGPRADAMLAAPGSAWSRKPIITEALEWGDGKILYLDYLDLEPLYTTFKSSLDQAARAGEEEAILMKRVVEKIRPRFGALHGTSCVKVSPRGVHYRSKGMGTGQFLAGALVGLGVYLPNMAVAREQTELVACKSNLKNIGLGLEMWSVDHDAKYPPSLEALTPDYLSNVPACPAAGADTYSASYRVMATPNGEARTYELCCQGHHHANADVPVDYPRYSGVDGLVEGP